MVGFRYRSGMIFSSLHPCVTMWHAFGFPFQAHRECCLFIPFTPGWLSMELTVVATVSLAPRTRFEVAAVQ